MRKAGLAQRSFAKINLAKIRVVEPRIVQNGAAKFRSVQGREPQVTPPQVNRPKLGPIRSTRKYGEGSLNIGRQSLESIGNGSSRPVLVYLPLSTRWRVASDESTQDLNDCLVILSRVPHEPFKTVDPANAKLG
jgi:hypothetical protein